LSNGAMFGTIWREIYSPLLWMCWAWATLVVAIAGPFGTFGAQPLVWRLIYWGVLIAVAIIIAVCLRFFWRIILAGRPDWQQDVAVSMCLAVVVAPCVVALNRLLVLPDALRTMGLLSVIGSVIAISFCMIAIRRLLHEQASLVPSGLRKDRLFTRFSADNGARLSRISSDNHHIRVITNDGEEHRLLMRLRDAVAEIDLEPGLWVHRSHWVARSEIVRVVRESGREVVELTSGVTVPIGPKYRPNLITAGVISA
jgi:hypothetical protein